MRIEISKNVESNAGYISVIIVDQVLIRSDNILEDVYPVSWVDTKLFESWMEKSKQSYEVDVEF